MLLIISITHYKLIYQNSDEQNTHFKDELGNHHKFIMIFTIYSRLVQSQLL